MSAPPNLFISYSWSSPEHEQWVLDLATELSNSGVHVILDKWDLREGQDSIEFMEKMVTDPSVSKVVMVCDKVYADKADGRSGGVGTETQIISAEVYGQKEKAKFVAVIAEKNKDGKPYVPTYYKSKIYIDLSESDRYAEGFEKLLRWIFDKPLHTRPEIGKPPSFVVEENAPVMGTSPLAKRVIEGFKSDKAFAKGALDEYLSTFSEQLERFRIAKGDEEFDELVVKSIDAALPARNEFISVITALVQYGDVSAQIQRLHRFFESLAPYLTRPANVNSWNESDFDNFKFIIHELFLYTIALLLRAERFDAATFLLAQPYFIAGNSEYGKSPTVTYAVFQDHVGSLEARNRRLGLRRLSVRADLLEQRSHLSGVHFRFVMQADFACFLRADLLHADYYDRWFPESLLYASRSHGPFEIFARAVSKRYLDKVLTLLGVDDVSTIAAKLDSYMKERGSFPHWDHQSFNASALLGVQSLGTKD